MGIHVINIKITKFYLSLHYITVLSYYNRMYGIQVISKHTFCVDGFWDRSRYVGCYYEESENVKVAI